MPRPGARRNGVPHAALVAARAAQRRHSNACRIGETVAREREGLLCSPLARSDLEHLLGEYCARRRHHRIAGDHRLNRQRRAENVHGALHDVARWTGLSRPFAL